MSNKTPQSTTLPSLSQQSDRNDDIPDFELGEHMPNVEENQDDNTKPSGAAAQADTNFVDLTYDGQDWLGNVFTNQSAERIRELTATSNNLEKRITYLETFLAIGAQVERIEDTVVKLRSDIPDYATAFKEHVTELHRGLSIFLKNLDGRTKRMEELCQEARS